MGETGGDTMKRTVARSFRSICFSSLLLGLFGVVFGAATVVTAADGDGGYAASYLQIPLGARPSGMGGAYIGVADDPAGVYYNPAGVTMLEKPVVGISYRVLGLGRRLMYASAMSPIQGNAILGGHWLHAGTEGVPARDADGDLLGHDLGESHNQLGFVFSKRFEKVFSLGATFSYVDVKLAEMSTNSVGIDIGIILHLDQFFDRERRMKLPVGEPRLGIVVRQLAKKFSWNSEKYELAHSTSPLGADQTDNVPFEIGAGLSGKILKDKLLLDVDVINSEKVGTDLRFGGEYAASPESRIRLGYGLEQLAFGAGYEFGFGKQRLRIDYAFSTNRAGADSEHIFSIDFRL